MLPAIGVCVVAACFNLMLLVAGNWWLLTVGLLFLSLCCSVLCVVANCCSLLFVAVRCCSSMFVVVNCCSISFVDGCCLLFCVVCSCCLLFVLRLFLKCVGWCVCCFLLYCAGLVAVACCCLFLLVICYCCLWFVVVRCFAMFVLCGLESFVFVCFHLVSFCRSLSLVLGRLSFVVLACANCLLCLVDFAVRLSCVVGFVCYRLDLFGIL